SLCSKTVNHASVQTVFVARPMAEFMEHGGIVFIQCIELFTQGHGYTVISRTVIGPVSRLMCNIGTRSYDKVFRPLQWIPLELFYIGFYQRCNAVNLCCIEYPSVGN